MDIYYECGDGWIALIENAKTLVSKYNLEHPELETPLEFVQIKEKFGGLCLYLNFYVPEIDHKIKELEDKSYNICEYCGSSENVKTEPIYGWIITLCDKCRNEFIKKYKKEANNN